MKKNAEICIIPVIHLFAETPSKFPTNSQQPLFDHYCKLLFKLFETVFPLAYKHLVIMNAMLSRKSIWPQYRPRFGTGLFLGLFSYRKKIFFPYLELVRLDL